MDAIGVQVIIDDPGISLQSVIADMCKNNLFSMVAMEYMYCEYIEDGISANVYDNSELIDIYSNKIFKYIYMYDRDLPKDLPLNIPRNYIGVKRYERIHYIEITITILRGCATDVELLELLKEVCKHNTVIYGCMLSGEYGYVQKLLNMDDTVCATITEDGFDYQRYIAESSSLLNLEIRYYQHYFKDTFAIIDDNRYGVYIPRAEWLLILPLRFVDRIGGDNAIISNRLLVYETFETCIFLHMASGIYETSIQHLLDFNSFVSSLRLPDSPSPSYI